MTKYHINDETDRVNICRAKTINSCPLKSKDGGTAEHFESKESAKKFQEERLSKEYGETSSINKVSKKIKQETNLVVKKPRVSKTVSSMSQTEIQVLTKNMFDEHEQMKNEISKKEYNALYAYAGNAYETINKTLRGTITDKDRSKISKQFGYEVAPERIELIDKAMKSHGYGHELKTVYRYYRLDKKQDPQKFIQENMQEGSELQDKGYMSTTEDLAFVLGHINNGSDKNNYIVLEITTDKGISLQDKEEERLGKIQSFERERLLPRDMKFKIEESTYQKLEIDESRETIINEYTRGKDYDAIKPQNLHVVKMIDSEM